MLIHRQGILDDEAAELELARLHVLEGAKEKKLAMVLNIPLMFSRICTYRLDLVIARGRICRYH